MNTDSSGCEPSSWSKNDPSSKLINRVDTGLSLSEVGPTATQRRGKVVNVPHADVRDMGRDLDDIDRSILYLLQTDARGKTAEAMAEMLTGRRNLHVDVVGTSSSNEGYRRRNRGS